VTVVVAAVTVVFPTVSILVAAVTVVVLPLCPSLLWPLWHNDGHIGHKDGYAAGTTTVKRFWHGRVAAQLSGTVGFLVALQLAVILPARRGHETPGHPRRGTAREARGRRTDAAVHVQGSCTADDASLNSGFFCLKSLWTQFQVPDPPR
jgi:hypothetical protein